MGTAETLTAEGKEACKKARLLIGAKRMLETVDQRQHTYASYQPEEIVNYIKEHPEYENVAVLLSGDAGFYSGASRLLKRLEDEPQIEPGSFQAFLPWRIFARNSAYPGRMRH